jgi:hypothetical protein
MEYSLKMLKAYTSYLVERSTIVGNPMAEVTKLVPSTGTKSASIMVTITAQTPTVVLTEQLASLYMYSFLKYNIKLLCTCVYV